MKKNGDYKKKERLTDRALKALPAEEKPYCKMDTDVTAFGVRVMPTGTKTFIMFRRFPGSPNPTRRPLGRYPELSLSDARETARDWNAQIRKGVDPSREAQRVAQAAIEAERARTQHTFGAALETYLKRKARLRTIHIVERDLRREFAAWMDKPLADISQRDIKNAMKVMADRGVGAGARCTYSMLRSFLNWCADSGDYGLTISPCAGIKPTILIGEANIGTRVLRDYELAAYWQAAGMLGYPYGPLFQLLALTALRRDEAGEAVWSEFDMDAGVWTIPAERMKGKPGKAAPHLVPLTADIMALLRELPRIPGGGDYLFSSSGGHGSVCGFSQAKTKLDAAMRAILEEQGKTFEAFKLHDIRRTARTRFGALPIEDVVRELLLAHARKGICRVYDLHAYEDEKRHALELWHAKLRAIVEPAPDNVVQLRATG